jgi:TATA-binding protein-associated factor
MAPTRLEKLVALLANGLSEASRLAAARQLGDLQRSHPRELHTLLQHILRHLFSSEWATRRAAAAALEAVADAVDQWSPHHPEEADAAAEDAARSEAAGAWLRFDSFQMSSVLAHGRPLLASAGVEFDEEAETASTGRERLLRQRKLLQEQLGMEAVAQALEGAPLFGRALGMCSCARGQSADWAV